MPGEIVAHNKFLKLEAERQRTIMSSGHSLRLFENDFRPKPQDALPQFVEATFAGYARKDLAGKWKLVFKVIDGEYQFSTVDLVFTGTASTANPVYGWYIYGGGIVKFSARLALPAEVTIGRPLTIRADIAAWAATVICEEG